MGPPGFFPVLTRIDDDTDAMGFVVYFRRRRWM
jgi:hypothetical protein